MRGEKLTQLHDIRRVIVTGFSFKFQFLGVFFVFFPIRWLIGGGWCWWAKMMLLGVMLNGITKDFTLLDDFQVKCPKPNPRVWTLGDCLGTFLFSRINFRINFMTYFILFLFLFFVIKIRLKAWNIFKINSWEKIANKWNIKN